MDDNPMPTRRSPVGAGFITTGTLVVAAVSALVLATGCRTAPPEAGADVAASACTVGTMPPLQPFDEQFYDPATAADAPSR